MDHQTLAHYDQHAADMSAQYESADVTRLHQHLLEALPAGGRILEVGCGSGRDLSFLQEQGFDVTGLEPSEGMRAAALRLHPGLADRLHPGTIPFSTGMDALKPPYDAILAIAVIMHLRDQELADWIRQLKAVLKPDGILFLSASYAREGLNGQRDEGGRLFVERTPEQVEAMMREGGLEKVRMFQSPDTLKRPILWFTQVYRLSPPAAPPTEVQQLEFLKNIQRLLNEGSFVASYKFALLHALADLAIVKGDDSGKPLQVPIADIAEQMALLYWQQARPFNNRNAGLILMQNAGPKQAAIVNYLVEAHKESQGSFYHYRKDSRAWNGLVRSVAGVVKVMPLWKLQTVGSEQVPFLYERSDDPSTIMLKPGVAYCFRAFYPMLCNLFRSAWIDYVRRFNTESLGHITDLREFMFGGERASLVHSIPILRTIQDNKCLYCDKEMHGTPDVDHFIPWSRCRSDLAHNLVLSHKGCNAAKSDHLACEDHLQAWTTRNRSLVPAMAGQIEKAALPHDLNVSERIATWAYSQTEQTHGQVWVARKIFKPLDVFWRNVLVFDLEEALPRLKNKNG